ncbi:DNA-binding response regulator [uncultured Nitrosomonas sp.]|uniref:DNA-binding response regulator n=1 Tax=uncultured Nitrosomonas sp. TaxID=156424 RepID=UPI00260CF0A4|nr:DNA-binding response regulator [uncultured Nitrosomonas sp.]
MDLKQLKRLPPSHYSLLEASREKRTTNTKVLAQYLDRTPATVRTQFQRIMALLEVHCRYEALRKAEEQGLIRKSRRAVSDQEE